MSKVNCEIVKDLIPSYVDGICSRSSREAVEEHVKNCGECRESLETLRRMELEGNKADQGELDHMKKVKQHFVRKSLLIVGGFAFVMLLFGNLFDHFEWWYSENLYYVMFPLVALGVQALLWEYPSGTVRSKKRLGLTGVSVLGMLYCVILAFALCRTDWADIGPLKSVKLGPFIEYQLIGIGILELIVFVLFVADSVKNEHALDGLYIVSLLVFFLNMILRTALRNMGSPALFQRTVIQRMVIVFAEGLGIIALEFCMNRLWYKDRQNKKET